ncbi:MAG: CSLREA domain-containing protein [Thermoleophilaceae bacterium]|nr:CSLREA domain-containing protein [Thermoleophilaceae bacterium]
MRRTVTLLAALAALLTVAPSALAATFAVDDTGDGPPGVGCDVTGDPDTCTLREAITAANASPDATNAIAFDAGVSAVTLTFGPLVLTKPNTVIGQERDTRVNWTSGGGPALTLAATATGSTLRRLDFMSTAPAVEPILRIEADGVFVDRGALRGGRADGAEVRSTAPATTDNVTFAGVTVTGNAQNGVRLRTGARNTVITASVFSANGLKPIALEGSANSGAGALGGLKVGPRQPDGTLPFSGTASTGGAVEVFRGNPFGPAAPVFSDSFGVSAGGFAAVLGVEPSAGEPLAATLTTGGAGTSEFALATVPSDIVSPVMTSVRAVNTSQLRIRLTEPVDAATVEAGDFAIEMASKPRAVQAVSVEGGGTEIVIDTAGGWLEGEAGYLRIGAPGAFLDAAGNANLAAGRVRVAAGPGDFTPPKLTKVGIAPKKFCPSGVKSCRGPRGATVTFTTNEEGKFELAAYRGKKRIGNRTFTQDKAGAYKIRFSGKLRAGRLSAGRYKLRFTMEDEVGNVSTAATRTIRVLGRKRR